MQDWLDNVSNTIGHILSGDDSLICTTYELSSVVALTLDQVIMKTTGATAHRQNPHKDHISGSAIYKEVL